MKISIPTDAGSTKPITDRSGIRRSRLAGCRIAMVTGPGSIPGAGPGLKMSLGDFALSILVAGSLSGRHGDGFWGRSRSGPSICLRWLRFLAAWDFPSAALTWWDGSRLDQMNHSFPG